MPKLSSFGLFMCLSILLNSFKEIKKNGWHPLHVAVVEITYNSRDKFAILQCKTFSDDLELALEKRYGKTDDISHPQNIMIINTQMDGYIKSRLQIKINNRPMNFSFINYKESDNNSADMFFKINDVNDLQKIEISDKVFYELYDDQLQLIYITVNGNRKNNKLRNPDSKLVFDF